MMTRVLAAALGTVAFALLFSVPKKYYPGCGVVGGMSWLIYLLTQSALDCTETEAIFFAAVVVIFLSRLFAVGEGCPVTVFLITGIFPLVPGAGVYWTAYYLVTGQLDLARGSGFSAVKAAFAIVLGIVIVFELPGGLFRALARPWKRLRGKERS